MNIPCIGELENAEGEGVGVDVILAVGYLIVYNQLHPADFHWLLLTLTFFSYLAEQCLVCI